MRIDTHYAASAPGGVTSRRLDGGALFALDRAPTLNSSAAATPAASLAGLDAILALQARPDSPEERRRRTARRGHDLLDSLDRLKVSLLMGRVSASDLKAIAGRLAQRCESGDPRLDALMADIELRAAVELAKLQAREIEVRAAA